MGRLSPEMKSRNRQSIVDAATEGFKKVGVDAFGVDDVMKAAGMTHGGFYNHFASKDDLVAAVCEQAFVPTLTNLDTWTDAHPDAPGAVLQQVFGEYLSAFHRDHPETGCPSGAMVTDAGRRDIGIQFRFEAGVEAYLERFEGLIRGVGAVGGETDRAAARAGAIGVLSQLVGGILLSRAVALANPKLSDELLEANRSLLTMTYTNR